ncbi:trafficking protein particle complex subunit brun isoform X2 [Megalopta genalis]|uniref:trafficking protein particle complex subunit brun isoform X2 n=1 Tax=Megalopta genalis TaxID=115081 RepID=UPI001442EFD7|nr:protein brunelleschi isoform X2 [Megalopta genalis]
MRSAISVILSSPVPDNKMSHPDYEQTAHDHAALLLLLRPIGTQIKQKTVTRLCERITKAGSRFTVVDSTGGTREILARFVKEHPVENNDWGDFQTHRKLLGLITFGKYDNQAELNELCRIHETLKVKYTATLYDSRVILFGPTESSNKHEPPASFSTPSNFKTRAVFYGDEMCPDLEVHTMECLNSLFWILESKRLERSKEKIDRVSLLLAPFEKKDFIGLDLESRNNRKRCVGRMTKHLGDLCLQAGLPADALSNYNNAASTLQAVNDWLWLGAAFEGLCAASALVLYPNMCRSLPLQRNSSLQEGSPGKQRGSQAVTTLPLPPAIEVVKTNMPHILLPEEMSKKYREAIVHYSKYQYAGIIETEASFKATRISIEQNCTLQAASYLSNVVLINLQLSEQEKIDRFTTLSDLYMSFGFVRKASFCLRLAATRHVSQNNPNPDWQQCYNLMLQATSGFKLSLDPVDMSPDTHKGWPFIQIKMINDLVAAANRMGNPALATRHVTFLLQTMYNYLTPSERRETALQLQNVSQQCEGAPVPLVLDSGTVIPPANLTNIPKTKSFVLKNMQPHLQPQKIERIKEDHGPFLFTPINFGSLERKNTSKSKVDYLWVEGDICEVSMQLINPLPFELHVSNMRLLTNGVVFESIPESITLPAESGPIAVTLAGRPKEVGDLEILGFSTHTLGVKSNCRLRYMEGMPHPQYTVEVVPALPRIEVATSLPQTASFSTGDNIVTSASTSLYGGESAECTVTITNSGQVPIDTIELSVQSTLDTITESKIFKWNDESLRKQLPLQPGVSASLTLYLHAATDFIAPTSRNDITSSTYLSQPSSLMSQSGHSSLPSRLSSPSHTKRQSELTSSFRSGFSSQSGHSSLPSSRLSKLAVPLHASNVVEGQLKIKYSGGAGLQAGYCRTSSVFVTIEMLPSVQITNWDVLPAETPSQFYLVLDLTNMTNHEMELHYTQTKCIYMEGKEPCRIPVPVDRCPLNKLSMLNGAGDIVELQKVCSEHIASLVDLQWQLLGTDAVGKASLSGITLTQDMLDLVRMSPLQWEIKINDAIVKAQDELTCNLGECVNVGVGICNALEHPLSDLILSINFYQDHHNGVNNYQLETRLSIAGANKVMLPVLQEYGRIYHECRVVFFTAGQYKIDIQCSSTESASNTPVLCSELINAGHTWRYIPSIEITVDDC